ncbi:MAG: hypothetical protein QGH25_17370 [Candidatus Latescibacteria bacterium]|nr:hypothetical protein [Candidatus Latescibacterota bacterium]
MKEAAIEGCAPLGIRVVHIGAQLQQQADHREIALVDRLEKRRLPAVVAGVGRRGFRVEQSGDRRPVARGRAAAVISMPRSLVPR